MRRAVAMLACASIGGVVSAQIRPTRTVVESRTEVYDDSALRAALARLEREIVVANIDRAALAERVAALMSRASRSQADPRRLLGSSDCGGWMSLVARHDWDVQVACRILWCESGGDQNARNGRHVGLFQIADGPADPAENVALAHRMYQRRGWQPWEASRRCWA